MTTSLFGQTDAAPSAPHTGPFASVALERGIDHALDYHIPSALCARIQIGQRVRVPLGRNNRPARGYVVAIRPVAEHPKTKDILAIEDSRTLLSAKMLDLARWISRYYVTPLGMVIQTVIPSAVKKKKGLGHLKMVRLLLPRQDAQAILEKTKAAKRRAILARLLNLADGESIELLRLSSEAGATAATVRKLVKTGLISITDEPDLPGLTAGLPRGRADEIDLKLNPEQQTVFDQLLPRMDGGFSVTLLHGVTGSGKTEVYLQCIRRVIASGRQALVLVPEIALTPQTVRRFEARFERVAILHSGLGQSDRHRYWQQIAAGVADVVVGARSAVFAPLPRLGVIVVDEEHDSSYKQDSAPRYHGRDVAVKRAQIESVPVILGSATPSLESYYKTRAGDVASRYSMLQLPHRVRGLSMPAVELVDLRNEVRQRRGIHLMSQRLEHLLRQTLAAKHQAILLLNRRGYSNFVYCAHCNDVIQCPYCDATLTYHRWGGQTLGSGATDRSVHAGALQCHYCLAVSPLPPVCAACGKKLSLFGFGTQRVEEELARKFPGIVSARVDSDTMRTFGEYEATLGRFARGEIQVMLGTQMIAKGLDYPNVTLVGVISADTALSLPDFRAGERTFQLITQVAGRAGRGDSAGRVAVQTFLPDDAAIAAALRQDYAGFADAELERRRETGLPPFTRMARIILRDQDAAALHAHAEELAAELRASIEKAGNGQVEIKGPMPCPVGRIAGYLRHQIVLKSAAPLALQRVLALAREGGHLTRAERVAVDVDPVSLL
jgi:primosomal protein N' (replication factor Y) (superfamily II helicase)